jgi:hypothetical protein
MLIYKIYGWLIIRPIRYFFSNMICAAYGPRWWFEKCEWEPGTYYWPNVHWWLLYKTVFRFFRWVYYEGWRHLCQWDRGRLTYPLVAKIIHRIGQTTAGYAIGGGQCYHCGSPEGCQVELSDSDKYFQLTDSWTEGTQEGTDYRFKGITTCPKCGYQAEYEDGSL